ncbi:hypothetical protein GCM10022415_19870 [Knoellia locipacati]|uniref:Uncharacterized protein n=1 Tax=Knoellia locipacati TaxID=882824 RepID=A0A512T141_9MICO|nr:DUF2568 domain-containing protein [Knoellia locipacati]GEQ13935.1 hypothetical protein KLO01_19820 [Knoellia locipacati]
MLVALGLLAFVIEFAFMVGVFMLASGSVGGGVAGSLLGVLAVVVVAALWGLFLAPRARHRLPKLPRALVAGGAVASVGAGLLGQGHQRFGLVLLGAGLVLVAAQIALDDGLPAPPPQRRRARGEAGDAPETRRSRRRQRSRRR